MPKLFFKEGHNCMASSDYDTSEHNIYFIMRVLFHGAQVKKLPVSSF